MSPPPDVSILVVAYRNPELTHACLRSVVAETQDIPYELIVVDNASGDSTAEMVRREFPAARLISLKENIGFACGTNLAAAAATGEFLLLLNPDTVVHDGAVQRLVEFARARPDGGLYGGRTLTPAGELDPRSCWGAQTLWSTFCFATGLSTAFRRSALFDPESLGGWPRDSVRHVEIVSGCLLLVRRRLWEELGGFDPSFFMYGEDADLALRAARRGYRPLITPAATITHVVGASSNRPEKTALVMRAKATLIRRHWPRGSRRLGISLLCLGAGARALGARTLGVIGRPSPAALARGGAWQELGTWSAGYSADGRASAEK